jgi:hypothetical protein
MANNPSVGRHFGDCRPSKGIWFWSCVASIIGTVVVGFTWGGWVTGGTATTMAMDAADAARTQLAAAVCISRFQSGPDASEQLVALKKTDSYERGDIIKRGGWATMPGSKTPVAGAADVCAQRLVDAGPSAPPKG